MTPQAVLFGSIGTLVETSEIQRAAFNAAFAEAGLEWHWDRGTYRSMLTETGGERRIALYAGQRSQTVDSVALHARKTALFGEAMRRDGLALRPGVRDVVAWARQQRVPLAFVTTTMRANVDAIFAVLRGVGGVVTDATFAFVGDASMVERPKPDPSIYHLALERLGVEPARSVAIEDTGVNLQAPVAAGIATVAFPGANSMSHDFRAASAVVDELDPSIIEGVLGG